MVSCNFISLTLLLPFSLSLSLLLLLLLFLHLILLGCFVSCIGGIVTYTRVFTWCHSQVSGFIIVWRLRRLPCRHTKEVLMGNETVWRECLLKLGSYVGSGIWSFWYSSLLLCTILKFCRIIFPWLTFHLTFNINFKDTSSKILQNNDIDDLVIYGGLFFVWCTVLDYCQFIHLLKRPTHSLITDGHN